MKHGWKKLRMFFRSVSGFTFPLLIKALVLSQPVNGYRATRTRVISSPRSLATAWTFTSRRLSPVPVSNSTVWFIWRTNLSWSKMNTSVSGDLTSITELSGELAAISFQCKIILVSASSFEEHNFSTSSVTTFFPSILLSWCIYLSLKKTKCFPCSFGAYFPFFHSSKRKLHKRLLFSSLRKNLFQSRGTLMEGPFTRCACEEPLIDRSNSFIKRGWQESVTKTTRCALGSCWKTYTDSSPNVLGRRNHCLQQSISFTMYHWNPTVGLWARCDLSSRQCISLTLSVFIIAPSEVARTQGTGPSGWLRALFIC